MKADGHETFQAYFAGVEAHDLPALRHLLGCPLCQQVARLLLAQGPSGKERKIPGSAESLRPWSATATRPARRPRARRGRAPR
jgi:hypothetical protein